MQAAAAAGFGVIALDAFADADTQSAARQYRRIPYLQGGFHGERLLEALDAFDLTDCLGMAYGSGFEANPDLLEACSERLPLIGNSVRVLRSLKRAKPFFTLLDVLGIPHPEVSFRPLAKAGGWLYKQAGGSGGTHIRQALTLTGVMPEPGCYFQREQAGAPVSLLFAADGKQARAIGYNRQWLAPALTMPCRYGGAVSQARLPQTAHVQLLQAAQQLTNAIGLRGLNSIDAILDGDRIWILEVNPRLTATMALYASNSGKLFALHVQASGGDMRDWPLLDAISRAHGVVYTWSRLEIAASMQWPSWVADRPPAGSLVEPDSPLCSVLAEGGDAEAAETLLQERMAGLRAMIDNR